MDASTIVTLLAFCTCASFIQRVSGFGFGIFVMTMLPHLMPSYGEATALSGILSACLALYVVVRMRKNLSFKRQIPINVAFIVVSYFAISFVASIDGQFFKKILGVILIVISVYFFFISEKIRIKASLPMQIGMGSLSGVMGGMFAMPGPPAVLYFLASEPTKEGYLAGIQTYFLISNVMMTVFRVKAGFVTEAVGYAWCVGIVGVLVGAFIGSKVFKRVPTKILRKIVYAYMAVSGVIAIVM